MDNFIRKIVMLLILVVSMLVTLDQGFCPKNTRWEKELSEARVEKKTHQSDLEIEKKHPFGNPIDENIRLWWEHSPEFQSFCFKHRATIRIAAFQTTLPDPLPGEEHNISLAASIIAGKVIAPGAIFSTDLGIGPRTIERNFKKGPAYYGSQVIQTVGGGICKIASTLYNVAVLANLEIVERWAHSMLVPYVPPGQDATIAAYKDFKFRNNTDSPIIIWAESKDNTLYMALYGGKKPPKVTWHHEILDQWKTKTIYRNNYNLKPGEEKIILAGADGMRVKSWLTIEKPNGEKTIKKLGVDYYYPMARVIERNPNN